MGRVREVLTHPAMHRTVPNVSRTEAEKCCPEQVFDGSLQITMELGMACTESHSEL